VRDSPRWSAGGPEEVYLGPASFTSGEELVATLAHERVHVGQLRDGSYARTGNGVDDDGLSMEDHAYAVEPGAIAKFKAGGACDSTASRRPCRSDGGRRAEAHQRGQGGRLLASTDPITNITTAEPVTTTLYDQQDYEFTDLNALGRR